MSENRKHERVPSRLRCWCEGENITVYARIGNLSEGGLFLRTSTPLERGSRATLRIGSIGLEASVTVVWSRLEGQGGPAGMGLQFENVDEKGKEAIRGIIQAHRSNSATAQPN